MWTRTAARCGLAAAMLTLAGSAHAQQRSLFDMVIGEPAAPAQAAPAAAQPRQARVARPAIPSRIVSVQNASQNTLNVLEVSGEGKSTKLAKPLAPKAKTTLKLPAMKGCMVSIAASFEGSGEAQASDLDICKDKLLRFTDG